MWLRIYHWMLMVTSCRFNVGGSACRFHSPILTIYKYYFIIIFILYLKVIKIDIIDK